MVADKGDPFEGRVGHLGEELSCGFQHSPGLLVSRVTQRAGGQRGKHDAAELFDAGHAQTCLHAASQGLQQLSFVLLTNM